LGIVGTVVGEETVGGRLVRAVVVLEDLAVVGGAAVVVEAPEVGGCAVASSQRMRPSVPATQRRARRSDVWATSPWEQNSPGARVSVCAQARPPPGAPIANTSPSTTATRDLICRLLTAKVRDPR
jgi:hypothetical protein